MKHIFSSDDSVKTSSCDVEARENSATSCPDINQHAIDDTDCPAAAQRDDDSVASSVDSSEVSKKRGSCSSVPESESQVKTVRRHVFDEMYEYYSSNERVKSILSPPSSDEMWFGDLDFSADLAALGFGDFDDTSSELQGQLSLMSNSQDNSTEQSDDEGSVIDSDQGRNDREKARDTKPSSARARDI